MKSIIIEEKKSKVLRMAAITRDFYNSVSQVSFIFEIFVYKVSYTEEWLIVSLSEKSLSETFLNSSDAPEEETDYGS